VDDGGPVSLVGTGAALVDGAEAAAASARVVEVPDDGMGTSVDGAEEVAAVGTAESAGAIDGTSGAGCDSTLTGLRCW
jgi:hypothetical protein